MQVVPVIDIMDGRVVRAVAGNRAAYRPIETPLRPGTSDPVAIAQALLRAAGDPGWLYVADLDGIMGGRCQADVIAALLDAVPGCRVLVDDGARSSHDVARWAGSARILPVIGTEALGDARALGEIAEQRDGAFALSLDHRGSERIGPSAVFEEAVLWPDTVIVMELSRVGTGAGPDLGRLAAIRRMAGPARGVFAAGGVRGGGDLKAIGAAGCGALVASALHSGAVTRADIEAVRGL